MKQYWISFFIVCLLGILSANENPKNRITKDNNIKTTSFEQIQETISSTEIKMLWELHFLAQRKLLDKKQEEKRIAFLNTLQIELETFLVFPPKKSLPEKIFMKAKCVPNHYPQSWKMMLLEILKRSSNTYSRIVKLLKNYQTINTDNTGIHKDWLAFYQWKLQDKLNELNKQKSILPNKLSLQNKEACRELLTQADLCIRLAKESSDTEIKRIGVHLNKMTTKYHNSLIRYQQQIRQKKNCIIAIQIIFYYTSSLQKIIKKFESQYNQKNNFKKAYERESQLLR